MIPITSSTTLSIEKTAKLLQNLINLKNKRSIHLPEGISRYVDSLLQAQQILVQKIDDYLHQPEHFGDKDKFETVSTIVKTCPEFLATQYFGRLPCHCAVASVSKSSLKYLRLIANVGFQHKVGGNKMRGGLLMFKDAGCNLFQMITDIRVFNVLKNHNPPLFHIDDVQKYNLLHLAVQKNSSLDVVKYLCDLDPSCLYQLDEYGALPLHCAIIQAPTRYGMKKGKYGTSLKVVQYLLQQSVSYSASNENIGGLFSKIPCSGTLSLDAMVEKWGRAKTWDCVERALSKNKNIAKLPILHQTIYHTPHYCAEVINRFPSSVHVRDVNNSNRLPIHVALEIGMKWSIELTYLITSSQKYMREVDPVTKLPPFVLAGMDKSCNLRTIYGLLHNHPEHVEMWCDGSEKYSLEDCKGRKMNQ